MLSSASVRGQTRVAVHRVHTPTPTPAPTPCPSSLLTPSLLRLFFLLRFILPLPLPPLLLFRLAPTHVRTVRANSRRALAVLMLTGHLTRRITVSIQDIPTGDCWVDADRASEETHVQGLECARV